jgi:hypothetical protein
VEPERFDRRHNVVLADTAVIRALGAAQCRQAADLDALAATLRAAAPTCTEALGPVGARFLAALTEAIDREAGLLAELSATVGAAGHTAAATAAAYAGADDQVGHSINAIEG